MSDVTKDLFLRTIAAIATPLGQGGVGIVRLSGPQALDIVRRLFRSARRDFKGPKPYILHHGWICDLHGAVLDETLVSYMPKPGSYTGEDVIEINCHGGPAVVQQVLLEVLNAGAQTANPGEFTLRAFLNGRLDLSQAESVAEMVSAKSQVGIQIAGTKLQGGLGQVVSYCKDRLTNVRAQLCLFNDFPEEEEDSGSRQRLGSEVQEVKTSIEELLANFRRYNCWREGALVVLAGKVNVGKSSLFNHILGRKRAIVTSYPGTTRDFLEETINLNGLPVRLVDIAGLRQTFDLVEQEGLDQGQELIQRADLVCLVFDLSQGEDQEAINLALSIEKEKLLAVANKTDLPWDKDNPFDWFVENHIQCLSVSAKTGEGIKELLHILRSRITGYSQEPDQGAIVPNLRQSKSLEATLTELTEM
ncbi:MAG TPA: tRNA uridine-5-carboxymethylaminomethyl(34) synthesis GTPase MnmE, partial [Desulfohalobiaceae bacterium]|nr:tRNA uridine-5-carboxymethylaminomethyl(34) synthesis GTPase MnmE [Desulfohalobiaceae bacterium]